MFYDIGEEKNLNRNCGLFIVADISSSGAIPESAPDRNLAKDADYFLVASHVRVSFLGRVIKRVGLRVFF